MTGADISIFFFLYCTVLYCIYWEGNLFQFSIHVYVCLRVCVGWVSACIVGWMYAWCVVRDACAGWCAATETKNAMCER